MPNFNAWYWKVILAPFRIFIFIAGLFVLFYSVFIDDWNEETEL